MRSNQREYAWEMLCATEALIQHACYFWQKHVGSAIADVLEQLKRVPFKLQLWLTMVHQVCFSTVSV